MQEPQPIPTDELTDQPPAPGSQPQSATLPPDVLAWIESGQRLDPVDEIMARLGANRADDYETRPESTVGRQTEIAQIQSHLARGRHVLLVGPAGSGKSHLLRHLAREVIETEDYISLDDFKAPKGLLIGMCLALHEAGHLAQLQEEQDPDRVSAVLSRWRIGDLSDLVTASLRRHKYLILIDNLETLTPLGVPVLQQLSDEAAIIATCKAEQIERITAVVDRFNQIELGPMSNEEIIEMLWQRLDRDQVASPPMLERRVIAQANGIPGVVVDASHKLAGSASRAEIRGVQPSAAVQTYVDFTWVIFVAAGLLIAMRYVARATDSATAYVAFGVLSALAMVARILLPRLSRSR